MALRLDRRPTPRATVVFAALALVVASSACDGGAVITRDSGGGGDSTIYYDLGGPGPDIGTVLQPGDPCPQADCFSDTLICIADFCRVKCTQPKPGCNHAVAECPVGTTCIKATTFTDACYPADGKLGDECDIDRPCGATLVCVQVSGPATCVALCTRGCQPGEQCLETSKGCQVCIKQP